MAAGRVLQLRLSRVEAALPQPKPPSRPVNLAALTEAEMAEVEALAARCTRNPGGRWFGDRWDLDVLQDAELERLDVLLGKAQGAPSGS